MDYRELPTEELETEKQLLRAQIFALEKRGAMLSLSQKQELSRLRRTVREIRAILGKRYAQPRLF